MTDILQPTRVRHPTLVAALRARADEIGDDRSAQFSFLDAEGKVEAEEGFWTLERGARHIGAALSTCTAAGDRAVLLFPPGLEFLRAFLGCLYAAVIAVPTYPPDPKRLQRSLPRFVAMVKSARPRVVLTTGAMQQAMGTLRLQVPELESSTWLVVEELETVGPREAPDREVTAETIAFLQYTSGSTGTPRGVMVTHRNLLHNIALCQARRAGESPRGEGPRAPAADPASTTGDVFVSWLPQYHDMGLIGMMLEPLITGAQSFLMSPLTFLQRPLTWLQAMTDFGATVSAAPNFAYDLCVRKIDPEARKTLDLRRWRFATNGAEPVREDTLHRFSQAFAPYGFRPECFYPSYGLAEATLMVSGFRDRPDPSVVALDRDALSRHEVALAKDDDSERIVGCGQPAPGQEIVIVDPDTRRRCDPHRVGEIWVAGPSVARGYWDRPRETQETFHAFLAEGQRGPYLRTGDLGFFLNRELYLTGRLKDLIIVRGRNHYPSDIERTAQRSDPRLRPGCSACFALEAHGGEALGLAAEVQCSRTSDGAGADVDALEPSMRDVVRAIRREVGREHNVQVHTVALLPRGTIPKTSSGKIQRRACRRELIAGSLETLLVDTLEDRHEGTLSTLAHDAADREPEAKETGAHGNEALVQEIWRSVLGVGEVGLDDDFFELGGDSLLEVEMLAACRESGLDIAVEVDQLPEPLTPRRLAAVVRSRRPRRERRPGVGSVALLPIQEMMLRLQNPNYFATRPRVYEARQPVDLGTLNQALQAVSAHHDALRARFVSNGDGWEQVVDPVAARQWTSVLPVAAQSEAEESDLLSELLSAECSNFDIAQGPPMKALVLQREDAHDLLVVVTHHLVSDLLSDRILNRDLHNAYRQLANGQAVKLSAPTTSTEEWAQRLRALGRSRAFDHELRYWQEASVDEEDSWLPLDVFPDEGAVSGQMRAVRFDLPCYETTCLGTMTGEPHRASLAELVITAMVRALGHWADTPEVSFFQLHHGRTGLPAGIDLARTVGCLGRYIPYALNVEPLAPAQSVASIREQMRQVPSQGLGYTVLTHYAADPQRGASLAHHPGREVRLNFLGDISRATPASLEDHDLFVPWRTRIAVANRDRRESLGYKISVGAYVVADQLAVRVSYDSGFFLESTIAELARRFEEELLSLAELA